MHGDITLNGCECMAIINTAFGVGLGGLGTVGRRLVESYDVQQSRATSNRVSLLNKMVKKTCVK